jgi:sugar lactone lactonase YvrE
MIVIWNDESQTEECSADVSICSKLLLDDSSNIFVLDQEGGLLDMSKEAGGCKNLAFRN